MKFSVFSDHIYSLAVFLFLIASTVALFFGDVTKCCFGISFIAAIALLKIANCLQQLVSLLTTDASASSALDNAHIDAAIPPSTRQKSEATE